MPRRKVRDPDQLNLFWLVRPKKPDQPFSDDLDSLLTPAFQQAGFGIEAERWIKHPEIYLTNPLIKPKTIEFRKYLCFGMEMSFLGNTLVFLPTGLGKTYIAMGSIVQFLSKPVEGKIKLDREKKVLFVAPTVVLVRQQLDLAKKIFLDKFVIKELIGKTTIKKRPEIWQESQIIFATPQTITSEINKGTIRFADVDFLIIDEAHLTTGNYDYVTLVELARINGAKILALSAVPPKDNLEEVEKFRVSLGVNLNMVFARSYHSADIQPWLYSRQLARVPIDYNHQSIIKVIKENLLDYLINILNTELKVNPYYSQLEDQIRKTMIYQQGKVVQVILSRILNLEDPIDNLIQKHPDDKYAYALKYYWALSVKVAMALDRLLTKGLYELYCYLLGQRQLAESEETTSTLSFVASDVFRLVEAMLNDYLFIKSPISRQLRSEIIITDPKVQMIVKIIKENHNKKIIIFTSLRDSLEKIKIALDYLNNEINLPVYILIGQQDNGTIPGMSRADQEAVCKKFQQEKQGMLIATSVAEMGLNLSVDIAICHEPVLDVRSYINRLGRVARDRDGQVYILTYQGSNEEKLYYIIQAKERRVSKIIQYYESMENPLFSSI